MSDVGAIRTGSCVVGVSGAFASVFTTTGSTTTGFSETGFFFGIDFVASGEWGAATVGSPRRASRADPSIARSS